MGKGGSIGRQPSPIRAELNLSLPQLAKDGFWWCDVMWSFVAWCICPLEIGVFPG